MSRTNSQNGRGTLKTWRSVLRHSTLIQLLFPCPMSISTRALTSFLPRLRSSAALLEFSIVPMSVLACLQPVAMFHSFWCSSVSQLLISSVTSLLETPTTGSAPVKFSLTASFASLSEVSLALIPLCLGI